MPGLVWLGYRWHVASDDVGVPNLVFCVLRTLQFVGLILAEESMSGADSIRNIMLAIDVVVALHVLTHCALVIIAGRGTIMNSRPRRWIPRLLYFHVLMLFTEIALWAVYAYEVNMHPDQQLTFNRWLARLMLFCTAFPFLILLILCDSLTKKRDHHNISIRNARHRRSWAKRFQKWFCCAGIPAEQNGLYEELATLLSSYFNLDLDLVPSDIAAGLILVRVSQMHQQLGISSDKNAIDMNIMDPRDQTDILSLAHYSKFYMASYNWPILVYDGGCCKLLKAWLGKCCDSSGKPDHAAGGVSFLGLASMHVQAGLRTEDIVYANFSNKLYTPCYYVCLDHRQKSVVVAIRGTLSMRDVMVCMSADFMEVELYPIGKFSTHKGMYMNATNILRELESTRKVDEALEKTGYNLVLLGHSLGAGTAAILSLLMYEKYQDRLKCYCYAPPACMSETAARFCDRFTTSTILGKDIVPRLGLRSMEHLTCDIVNALSRCRYHKWSVLGNACMRKQLDMDHLFLPSDAEDMPNEASLLLSSAQIERAASGDLVPVVPQEAPWLYLPGNIVHLCKIWTAPGLLTKKRMYQAMRTSRSSYSEILVSSAMAQDHLPATLHNVLLSLGTQVLEVLDVGAKSQYDIGTTDPRYISTAIAGFD